MRMAAPVGQARTHAGPPFKPAQESHLPAVFATSFGTRRPIRLSKLAFGATSASWITLLGLFLSLLLFSKQESAMET